MHRIGMAAAIVVVGVLCEAGPSGQQPAGDSADAAIKAQGLGRSQAAGLFHTLTDVIGPRLSGSCSALARGRVR